MKKTLTTLILGLAISGSAVADDLMQVYSLAAENDPIINRAKAQKDAAYSSIGISRANLMPQLSGSVNYFDSTSESFQPNFGVFDRETTTLSYGIDLRLSLYDHSLWLGLNRAELIAQQSDANLAAELQALMQRTVEAYLAVLRQRDNVEFVKAELRAIERQLEQTKQRFEVGLTAITDVHEAQANFDNTVARQIVAENTLELRLEELREITGKYHDELFVLDTEVFSPVAPAPNDAREWVGIAEESGTEVARANFIVASENLELNYRQTVRTVRSSFNDVRASIATISALEQSVISAESALQATEAGFDVGTRTIVDVLNSTQSLFDARRNLADARYTFISSIIRLKQASGTLTVADLDAINRALKPAVEPTS